MKWLVQKPIELYWRLIEPSRRRQCLFRESCSHHVHRVTTEQGALKGLFALFYRVRQCRDGYFVTFDAQLTQVLNLADGTVIRLEEASVPAVATLNSAVDVIRGISRLYDDEPATPMPASLETHPITWPGLARERQTGRRLDAGRGALRRTPKRAQAAPRALG